MNVHTGFGDVARSSFLPSLGKKVFTVRVVRYWKRLPREVMGAQSLAVFKAMLDGALSNLVKWKLFLLMAGGLEDDLSSPF